MGDWKHCHKCSLGYTGDACPSCGPVSIKEDEFDKYVELIASMTTDRMMGGIDRQVYYNNLVAITEKMSKDCDVFKGGERIDE